MKVYLGNITGGSVTTTPLTSGLLRCYAEQHDLLKHEVEWGDFLYNTEKGVDWLVENKIKDPDVLGLSCYTWNLNRNLKIAMRVKEKYPKCLVVFGGPEISEITPNLNNVDLMVMGEGELAFTQILIEYIYGSGNWHILYNVHYKKNGEFVYKKFNDSIYLKSQRDTSPWINGYFDFIVDEMAESNRQVVGIIETNRGCPNKCTFCVSGNDNRPIQTAQLDLILDELDYVGRVSNEIIMTDANFGLLKQDEIIAEKLAEVSKKYGVLTKIFVSWSKGYNDRIKRIAKILIEAGLTTAGVTVSLQTTTPKVLETVKRKNIDMELYTQAINDFKDMGVLTHTEFIIGLPEETKESFLTSVEQVLDVGPTILICYMLTMNANSIINSEDSRVKHKIKTQPMNIYHGIVEDENEYIESILSSKYISEKELRWLFKWKDFYAITYGGLWLYFISQYCKREYDIRRVDFLSTVLDWGFSHPDSVIGKCIKNWYINKYNSGSSVAYIGPKSPHNVDWGTNFFLKQTFHWLCISENREEFYKEIKIIIEGMDIWNSKTEDALKFQRDVMIDYDYDPYMGVTFDYEYNWFDYFHFGDTLLQEKNDISYTTRYAGRRKLQIKPNDPASIFVIAGGDLYKQQMQNTFIHRYTDDYEPTTSNIIRNKI